MNLHPGQQVGELSIERTLGRGAYGVVYLARDTLLGRRVALKVLPAGARVTEEVRERTLTEARLVSNLNSPHIVTLYRLHAADGGWTIEMEYVEGGSLEELIREGEPLPLLRSVEVFRGVCTALRTAHAARIIHGDIKPANVLLGAEGRVKLADFGLARMLEDGGAEVALGGRVFGSPRYMAPEVISGQSASMASDVWSAAVLTHRLLSGRFPFDGDTFVELHDAVLAHEPRPLGPEIPAPLASLVARCFAKRAEVRPSAAAILDEMDRTVALGTHHSPAERPTNWVPATTSFIGREEELSRLAGLLADESVRLVTLTGPGGIGKTRLSKETCGRMLRRFEGGCWFVDLSEIRDADGVANAVGDALGVRCSGEKDPARFVSGLLLYRKDMLLVLDNFEQVLASAPATVGLWLREAPAARFLVTSRAPLGLAGERQVDLGPLPTPSEGVTDPGAFAGVRLFVERAREASPSFALDDSNVGDVVRISRELEGMPLALELAAARARIMGPAQIARRLGQKFQLLKSTRLDLSTRQRTLEGAIEWSYDLLEAWERDAFLQACFFRDGFTVDAAEAVLELSVHGDAPPVMDALQSLRDKSLLTARDTGPETRLSMYRAVGEYGAAKWARGVGPAERDALARRHASYYAAFTEEWNARIPGPREQEALDRIEADLGNLLLAREGALAFGDGDLGARLALGAAATLNVRRPPPQVVPLFDAALASLPEDHAARAALLTHLAAACHAMGDLGRALASGREAVRSARAPEHLAAARLQLAETLRARGDLEAARETYRAAEEPARASGRAHLLARAIGGRGMVVAHERDLDEADACYREAEQLARVAGDLRTVALHVGNRGVACEQRGELEAALALHREAEDIGRRIGDRQRVAVTLGNRANVLAQMGRLDDSLPCYTEAEDVAREIGAQQRVAQIIGNRGAVHAMKGEQEEALACYGEAERIAREIGDRARLVTSLDQRARILGRRSDPEGALACFAEAEEVAGAMGDRALLARILGDRGMLLRGQGRDADAWSALSDAVSLYERIHADRNLWSLSFKTELAILARERREEADARQLARECLKLAEEIGVDEKHGGPDMQAKLATLRDMIEKE